VSGALLEVRDLNKSFGALHALSGFSLSVSPGEILGLVGPNGAGKTTLFNAVTAFVRPESGTIMFKGLDITTLPPHRVSRLGISRTFQILRLVRQISVVDNILLAFQRQPGEVLWNALFRWGVCATSEASNRESAMWLLDRAGLSEKAHDSAEALSYGQQKLVSLICCVASGAELLLLDEPVAGIAPGMVDRVLSLIMELPTMGRTVVLIEHNMDAVVRSCDRVVFMDAGRQVVEGTPGEVRADPRVIEAYTG